MRPERPPKPSKETGPAYTWDEAFPTEARPLVLWEYASRPLWVQAMPSVNAVLLLEKTQVALRDAVTGEERWRRDARELPDEVHVDEDGIHLAAGRDSRSLDPLTGEARWRQTQGGVVTGINSDAAHVYLTTRGPLLALDRRDGKVRWRVPCAWEPALHPCPREGVLLVDNPEADTAEALEAATGKRLWEFESEGQPVTVGAVVDGLAALSCHGNGAAAVSVKTGERRWRLETGGIVEWPAVALGGRLFFTDGDVHAVEAATGEVAWTRKLADEHDRVFTVRVVGELILAETWQGRLVALNAADGKFRWEHRLGQLHGAVMGPRHLYARFASAGETKGWSAYALDPADGSPAWSLQAPKVIADLTLIGDVLVLELRNRVLALRINAGE